MNRFKKAFNWYEKAVNKDITNNTHEHIDAKETFEELTLHFIQNNDDLESIIKLEKLIEQKKKELNQKV